MAARSRAELAFDIYCSLGPGRSLRAVRDLLAAGSTPLGSKRAPSLRTLENWSGRHGWQKRLADLEQQDRVLADQQNVRALREHRERQRRDALLLQELGRRWLEEKAGAQVKAAEALRALDSGYRLEALALGKASDRLAVEASDDRFKKITDDELELVIKLARESADSGIGRAGETPP